MHDSFTSELPQQLDQINRSALAISNLVTDLMDFTSSTLGVSMRLVPARADLHLLCEEVLREMRAARPGQSIRLSVRGDVAGTWDPTDCGN